MLPYCLVLILGFFTFLAAAPQQGQIVVDPQHPGRMVYHNTYTTDGRLKPVFFAGPGDPEDFFYNNTQANIDLLTSKGARCTYITAYLGDFGGGNPGSGADLDNTLNQWEQYITQLENAGIITVFFFFDDSYAPPSDWQTAVDKIVAKFKHHKLLIWSVAEEYQEALSASQVSEVAARIKGQDDYDHIVGVHQLGSVSFDFNGDANLQMFLIQNNVSGAADIHDGIVSAWGNTGGNKILNMAEIADHAMQDRTTVRRWNWAAALGGASAVQVLWMGRAGDPASQNDQGKYDDCAALMDFMESTDFNFMAPHDELALGASQWVLAQPGVSYIVYADGQSGDVGVKSMTTGSYTLQWLDLNTGARASSSKTVSGGDNLFARPSGIGGGEVVVWIAGGGGQEQPQLSSVTISPKEASMLVNGAYTFTAQARDQYGQNFTETMVWSTGGGGSVSNGLFTSNGQAGIFNIYASASSNLISRTVPVLRCWPNILRQEYRTAACRRG